MVCTTSLRYHVLQGKGKGKVKSVSTREEAAGMIGSMTAGNVPNQDAFRAAGALPLLLDLVLTADKSIKVSMVFISVQLGQRGCQLDP